MLFSGFRAVLCAPVCVLDLHKRPPPQPLPGLPAVRLERILAAVPAQQKARLHSCMTGTCVLIWSALVRILNFLAHNFKCLGNSA